MLLVARLLPAEPDLADALERVSSSRPRSTATDAARSSKERLGLWGRFVAPEGWWLAAMALLWLLFMAVLFVIEPRLQHSRLKARAARDPAGAVRWLQRLHWLLLAAGLAVAAAGLLGAHGALG